MRDLLKNRVAAILISFCLIVFFTNASAQVQTPKYITTTQYSKGYYEYLPKGYESGSATYPLIIFVHGIGECGDGSPSQLPKVLVNGPPSQINQGIFPDSFVVKGQTFRFIVLSPQFVQWPASGDIYNIIDYAIRTYRVDVNRIYLTGLSMGGGVVWDYAGTSAAFAKRIAAIVPISGASAPDVNRANIIAAANLPVWATHNINDPVVASSNTINYVSEINSAPILPNPLAKKTIFNVSGHDAWYATYQLNFKDADGKPDINVYQWMLQFSRGSTAAITANVWLGVVSAAWENPLNWSLLTVPDANSDVIINADITVLHWPDVSSNASVRSLKVTQGAKFTVNAGYKFSILH